MNTRVLVTLSLLVGIGAVLHAVVPGVFMGIKPDLMLTMMFLGILLFPDKKNVVLLGIATGIIAALTTTFPSGQIPNIIDKVVTSFIFFAMFELVKKIGYNMVSIAAITAVGTLISGAIFLGTAFFIAGLPGSSTFLALYSTAVLPAAIINTIVMTVVYPIVSGIVKRTNLQPQ